MEYKVLAKTGLKVSRLCLGTMTFGGQTSASDADAIIKYAYENGVNFIDTADIYPFGSCGDCETIVGKSICGFRDQLVLATKVGGPMGMGKNQSGLSRVHIVQSVEASLKRLGTDYIDVYYMHFPDNDAAFEESITAMDDLVRCGKIRYYGLSNFAAWQCCSMVHRAMSLGRSAPIVSESMYSLISRGIEDELVPFLKEYQMGLTVYNPLAGGMLTGKHSRNRAAENSRYAFDAGYAARYWKARNFDAIDALKQIASAQGMSLVELSFKWLTSKDVVTSVICGVSNPAQIKENLSYFNGRQLNEKIIEQCDVALPIEMPIMNCSAQV